MQARATGDNMINKIAASVADALADVKDGSTILIGGFGTAGIPMS
jgi:3-oxoadipate CoA-transferase alpha subunit